MSESGKERFIFTKSYEIAYALFRIAGTMQGDFSERFRKVGAGLLEAAALQDYGEARNALRAIECFVKFAGDVALLTPANTDALLREVYVLDAAVIERMNTAKYNGLDVAEIFSEAAAHSEHYPTMENAAMHNPAIQKEEHAGHFPGNEEVVESGGNMGLMKAEMRQSAIMEKIRQSGNCRIKEIQEILPDCSERTIRYDLQSLLEKNLIERIGTGGPSVAYRIRQG